MSKNGEGDKNTEQEQVEGWKVSKLQREKRRVEGVCRDDTRRDV